MAYASISKPSLHFNTKLYTGTGSSNAITGVGFQPDFTWIKKRSGAENHAWFDAVRGVTKYLKSDETAAEVTEASSLSAFGADGFTVVSSGKTNTNSATYASWNWKGNGAGSANTDGQLTTTVSANTTSGFSIATYSGDGSSTTFGHGLGVKPKVSIIKSRTNGSEHWFLWMDTTGNGTADVRILLNGTNGNYGNNFITFGTDTITFPGQDSGWNQSSNTFVSYNFVEKKGYSKFGSYQGNSSTDGTFVYLGFKPAFVIIKETGTNTQDWHMNTGKINGYNVQDDYLAPNSSASEVVGGGLKLDMLSNGFKLRANAQGVNTGYTYIYMAFAAEPLVANVGASIPATAR